MARKKNKTRADGRIAVQIYLGMVDGKRKYKTVYGSTQKEAEEKALRVKLQLKKGLDVCAERDTFGQWAQRFLSSKEADGISWSQLQNYRISCGHLNEINDIPIFKIRSGDIQDIITRLYLEKGLAKRTLKLIRDTAKLIFQMAVEARVLDFNAALYVKIPKDASETHRRALDQEQQWIIDTPHRARRAAMIMMYSGLRRGELIALTWADIDLDRNTITVNKAVEMINGRPVLKDTKTKAGTRIVNIPKRLSDFLAEEKASENPLCLYVAHSAKGTMLSDSAWNCMWNSYLKKLNIKYGYNDNPPKTKCQLPFKIPRFTAHYLRHTFATLLYLAGVDVMTARDQMGHANIQTTLGIYTHLDKIYKRREMNKLDDLLNSGTGF